MDKLQTLEAPELKALGESRAEQIRKTFLPMAEMIEQFEDRYAEILTRSSEGIDDELITMAKRLRLDIGKIRIETDKLRKEKKEEHPRAGQAIDAVAKIVMWAVSDKEWELKKIEQYHEEQENKRLEELQAKRVEELSKYVEDAEERDLSGMDPEVWEAYLSTKKRDYEDRKEAERKAEEQRKEQARLAKLYDDRKEKLIPYWEVLKDDHKSADYSGLSEEDFTTILEEAKKAKEERDLQIAAQRVHTDRMNTLAPFINFVPAKVNTDLSQLTEREFNDLLREVKAKKEEYDKEQAAIREENERLKREEQEKAAREKALSSGKDLEKLQAFKESIELIQVPTMRGKTGKAAQDQIEDHLSNLRGCIDHTIKKLTNESK